MDNIAEDNGLKTKILSLDRANSTDTLKIGSQNLIGIVFPTHGFTAPWHVLKSVWNLPQGNSTHAFCVATRAGLKFGPIFVPGISGSATFVISLILHLKGYNVRGTMSVDMPSNWYTLHPIQKGKNHEPIKIRAKLKVAGFMDKILNQSRVWITGNNLYEITLGTPLSFISAGYLLFGRFFLAKLFFANNSCDGCGLCAKHCSVQAVAMWGKNKRRPYWKYNCESCMKCAALCPKNAIEAGHSWGIILYLITTFPVSVYLFSLFGVDTTDVSKLHGHWVNYILNIIYFYLAIFGSYYIFSVLIRIPLMNYLFTHTTMTHLRFWGRYWETKTKFKDIS